MSILDTTPSRKPDSIWRNLFWPSIRSEVDVDQIGRQGFWLCFIIAAVSTAFMMFAGDYLIGCADAIFYLLAGVGVRQRSRAAAIIVTTVYLLNFIAVFKYFGPGFDFTISLIFLGLLFANVRGTFLSAKWREMATEPPPVRQSGTLGDRLADQMPLFVWPVGQWFFYLLGALEITRFLLVLFSPSTLLSILSR